MSINSQLQYIFDYVVEFLLDQNGVSFDYKRGLCLYDGPEGKHCAVGCLLKPGKGLIFDKEEVGVSADDVPFDSFRNEFTESISIKDYGQFYSLLNELQGIHDAALSLKTNNVKDNFFSDWMINFRNCAESFDLDPGILVTWID